MSKVADQAVNEQRDTLTPAEAREYVAEQVEATLGMSLDEFHRRAEAGDLPDHPAIPHLVLLTGARNPGC